MHKGLLSKGSGRAQGKKFIAILKQEFMGDKSAAEFWLKDFPPAPPCLKKYLTP
jgi:hypothetical protein